MSERVGYTATLLLHGRVVAERVFGARCTVTLGESADATFVVPGLGGCCTWVEDGRLRGVQGLRQRAGEDDSVEATVALFPAIALRLRREVRPPAPGVQLGALLPAREVWRGGAALGCLAIALLAARPATVLERVGEEVAESPIARVMFHPDDGGPAPSAVARPSVARPVAVTGPQAVALPEVAAVEAPAVAEEPGLARASAPRVDATALRGARGRRRAVAKPAPPASHPREGEAEASPAGAGGTAAIATPCDLATEHPKSQVDLVFVLDVSTTMGFVIGRLADEIHEVGRVIANAGATAQYGLVVFVDDVRVAQDGRPYDNVEALAADFRRFAAFASGNGQLSGRGDNVDWPENSLDALHAAATRFDWRDGGDTARIVVHVTDDGFAERGVRLSGLAVQRDYGETVARLKERRIRVASFGAELGGSCECEDVTAGLRADFRGSPSIPAATGGAAFDVDRVAAGTLRLADAIGPLVRSGLCHD